MEENNICPICKNTLSVSDTSTQSYADYHCNHKDHFFAKRMMMGQLIKVKLRVPDKDNPPLYIKVNFDDNSTQVWKKHSTIPRINIDHACKLDFSDLDKIKNKIKTYLLFS